MKLLKPIEEKLLLLKIRKKDPDAFAKIYDANVAAVYRFIYFKVATSHDAEDITSDVFLKTWQYIVEGDEPINNIRSLLYRIARNSVVDFYRKRAHADVVHDEEVMVSIPDDRQQQLLEAIDTGIDMQRLERYVRRLKDEYREIILLRYVEDLSLSEIAKALDKSVGAVRVLSHRAVKILKHIITSEDIEIK